MRIEHDLLGEKSIPDDVYFGVQTARALENFRISEVPISQYPDLIRALAIVKLAVAKNSLSSARSCRTPAVPELVNVAEASPFGLVRRSVPAPIVTVVAPSAPSISSVP